MNSTKEGNTAPTEKSEDDLNSTSSQKIAMAPPMLRGKRRLDCQSFQAYRTSVDRVHFSPSDSLTQLMAIRAGSIQPRSFGVSFQAPELVKTRSESSRPSNEDEVDYGYGIDIVPPRPQEERATKRRRMQRRNSKTPAMMRAMSINASKVSSELYQQGELKSTVERKYWDDADVQIAEDLVRSLRASEP